jgi:4-carboxymuconolactone decarboxylase
MSHFVRLAAALAVLCLLSLPLKAQDRMPPIPADKLTEAQKKAAEAFAEGRGYAVRSPFVR